MKAIIHLSLLLAVADEEEAGAFAIRMENAARKGMHAEIAAGGVALEAAEQVGRILGVLVQVLPEDMIT